MRTGILAAVLAACAAPWAAAVDCKATSGTERNDLASIAACDRWIACKASKGLQCDDGRGTLGTAL